MHVHFGVELLQAEWQRSVVCIGTFDGVHLGHQAVIRTAVERAREKELPCIVVTFDRHPAAILAPDRCPGAIAAIGTNLHHFEELGAAVALILPFNKELSLTSAENFFQHVLLDKLRVSSIVVGHDFAFGHDRQGTPDWLKQRIETEVVPPFQIEGVRVSSSAIRRAVEAGDLDVANTLLGRPFEIPGIVVEGQRLGRTLGYPTANLVRSFNQISPADGIYAGSCDTPFGTFKAAVSIGVRPSVADTTRTIEAYLLDYPGDALYGMAVLLRMQRKLRDQYRFESLDALKIQIASDVQEVSRVI